MKITQSISIIKALSDSSRLQLINALREKPQYVEELAERLNLAVSTVSFHLKKLESAGLIRKVKEQYYVIFSLDEEKFNYTLKELTSFMNEEKPVQDKRMKMYRDKVVKAFVKRGRIEKLPAQYKKRILLYEDILKKFEVGKEYTEKETGEIIKSITDDYVTVRRAFIDEKMMSRKNGIYKVNSGYVQQFPSSGNALNTRKEEVKKMDKSEIKKAYKMSGAVMGVYIIRNPETGNNFLGSALNVNGMINRHKFELSTRMHQIKELQDLWNKSGESGLDFEILDNLERKEDPAYIYKKDLSELENLWAEKLLEEGVKLFRLKATKL